MPSPASNHCCLEDKQQDLRVLWIKNTTIRNNSQFNPSRQSSAAVLCDSTPTATHDSSPTAAKYTQIRLAGGWWVETCSQCGSQPYLLWLLPALTAVLPLTPCLGGWLHCELRLDGKQVAARRESEQITRNRIIKRLTTFHMPPFYCFHRRNAVIRVLHIPLSSASFFGWTNGHWQTRRLQDCLCWRPFVQPEKEALVPNGHKRGNIMLIKFLLLAVAVVARWCAKKKERALLLWRKGYWYCLHT